MLRVLGPGDGSARLRRRGHERGRDERCRVPRAHPESAMYVAVPVPCPLPGLNERYIRSMKQIPHDPSTVPAPGGGYVNALEVEGAPRTLFISGQIPETREGVVPDGAEEQCRQIWRNIVACLESAGLGVSDLVHVRTYLSDRSLAATNTEGAQRGAWRSPSRVDGCHRRDLRPAVAFGDRSCGRGWVRTVCAPMLSSRTAHAGRTLP